MRRNYWLSLSFANLVYLPAWAGLVPIRAEFLYYFKAFPGLTLFFATAFDVLALSLLTFLLVNLAPKVPAWLQRALPIAAVAMVALAFRSVGSEGTDLLRGGLFRYVQPRLLFPIAGLLAAILTVLAYRFSSLVLRLARVVAGAAIPCLAVTFVGMLFSVSMQQRLPPDPPLAPRLAASPAVRVIWVLFDEWDQRLSFSNRAPEIHMPIIDGLDSRSFTATRALAVQAGTRVSDMATTVAVPSLLYGKLVVQSEIESVSTRRLDFAGDGSAVFGGGDSIFARIRAHGWNSAVAGWYLPYCRVFASQLTDCYWDEAYEGKPSANSGFPRAVVDETRILFETKRLSVFGHSLLAEHHAAEYEALLVAARRYVADPSLGLVFLHINVPHRPYLYSQPKMHSVYQSAKYDDSLELVDRAVGEMLTSLQKAGLDSKTAIILSSDHPDRFPTRIDGRTDPHVPFIVHLPGQSAGVVSGEEFSTIRTPDLVLAIASGTVKSPSDIMAVLGIGEIVHK